MDCYKNMVVALTLALVLMIFASCAEELQEAPPAMETDEVHDESTEQIGTEDRDEEDPYEIRRARRIEEELANEIKGYDHYKEYLLENVSVETLEIGIGEMQDSVAAIITKQVEPISLEYGHRGEFGVFRVLWEPHAGAMDIVIILVDFGDSIVYQVTQDFGSFYTSIYLADLDGDGCDEILVSDNVAQSGGAGGYSCSVYKPRNGSLQLVGVPPEDSGFSSYLGDGSLVTVAHKETGFQATFTKSYEGENNVFDEQGNVRDNSKDWELFIEGYGVLLPIYKEDGTTDLFTKQYSSLWGRTDGVGDAMVVLRYNPSGSSKNDYFQVVASNFYSYEYEEDRPDFCERWLEELGYTYIADENYY